MPLFSDYHTHPLAHDPHRRYSREIFEEWLREAQEKEIRDLVFTDHDRFRDGVIPDLFYEFQESLPEGIQIKLGVELDNDPETSEGGRVWTEKNYDRLDFILGSIHFIDEWPFDHPDHRERFREWNIDELYETYYREIRRIASDGIFDGLAHLDLIKIFSFFPEKDMTPVLDPLLDLVKKNDLTIEASTAGWHKPVGEQYPSLEILKLVAEKEIPITTASDAHAPAHLARDYDKLHALLLNAGFSTVATFHRHKKTLHSIL